MSSNHIIGLNVFLQTDTGTGFIPTGNLMNIIGFLAAAIILIVVALLIWWLYERNLRRMRDLETSMQEKAKDLQQSEERYRQLVEQITAVTYVDDVDFFSTTIYISPQVTKLSGYTPEEWKAKPSFWFDIIHPEDRDSVVHENGRTNKAGEPFKLDYRLTRKNGDVIWVHDEAVLTEMGGRKVWHGVIYDITEQKNLEESLRYISNHDVLTGLYNRTYFNEELSRLQKSRHFPVSIIIADMDGLKWINDQHGHAMGDRLIKQAARLFESVFRQGDVIARTGGDEFIILLPGTDEPTAIACVQRIRENLEKRNKDTPRLSISLGVATATRGTSVNKAMKNADDQMYLEKEAKRLHLGVQSKVRTISLVS